MKKIISLLIICFFTIMSINGVGASNLYSQYIYAYDTTSSQILYDLNSEKKMYPASMTKVMTVYTALLRIDDLDEKVTVIKSDVEGWLALDATVAGFTVGERISYRDLMYGAIMPSGADACRILARVLYGSEEAMVSDMNKVAASIGLKNTHFKNVTGLHNPDHYTTAKDMVTIVMKADQNQEFHKIFTAKTYQTSDKKLSFINTINRNQIRYGVKAPYIKGAKSGYTEEAGMCLASTYNVDGHTIYMVNAGATDKVNGSNIIDANTISTQMNQTKHNVTLFKKGETVQDISIRYTYSSYEYKASEDIKILVDTGIQSENIESCWVERQKLEAPLKEGDLLGYIEVSAEGKTIQSIPVYAYENIYISYLLFALHILMVYVLPVLVVAVILLFIIRKVVNKKRKRSKRY